MKQKQILYLLLGCWMVLVLYFGVFMCLPFVVIDLIITKVFSENPASKE